MQIACLLACFALLGLTPLSRTPECCCIRLLIFRLLTKTPRDRHVIVTPNLLRGWAVMQGEKKKSNFLFSKTL
ncbi:uncharacterized protein F4812DRAFT_447321 [Daldinia caldariorum]|uniref:uncharacterized protein n=1 Tax=Daldinia caldariorum TaxID=326644 RepID=UPI002008130A|nr:uncharacterized protein F4812DRAFT_447321 [Daldinia caldariorum]KAI1463319.1 hypothetical protein F4812DRAFT_447321 [Daldinia caldariorum]